MLGETSDSVQKFIDEHLNSSDVLSLCHLSWEVGTGRKIHRVPVSIGSATCQPAIPHSDHRQAFLHLVAVYQLHILVFGLGTVFVCF